MTRVVWLSLVVLSCGARSGADLDFSEAGGATASGGRGAMTVSGGRRNTAAGGSSGTTNASGGAESLVRSCNDFCNALRRTCGNTFQLDAVCGNQCAGALGASGDCQRASGDFFRCANRALRNVTSCDAATAALFGSCADSLMRLNACQ